MTLHGAETMEGREISDYHLEVFEAPFVQSTLCSLSFFHVFAQTIFKKGAKISSV